MVDMTDVLNESAADKQVIKSLLKEIKELKSAMSKKLLFDENGKLYFAHHYEEVNTEELDAEIKTAQDEIASVEHIKSVAAKLSEATPAAEPTAPVEPSAPAAPAPTETPITEAPAPAPVADQQPAVTEAPTVAAPAQDATPIVLQ